MKKNTLNRQVTSNALAFVTLICSQFLCNDILAQTADSCKADTLNISTGFNHFTSAMYAQSNGASVVQERFWRITRLPTNNDSFVAPSCAEIYDQTFLTIYPGAAPFTNTRWIGFNSFPTPEAVPGGEFFNRYSIGGSAGPINAVPTTGVTDEPTRFTRTFFVNASTPQTVTFSIRGKADDKCFIQIDANPAASIYSTSSASDINSIYYRISGADNFGLVSGTTTDAVITKTITLTPGAHTIDVDVYDIAGNWTGLDLSGTIISSNSVLLDSKCFGAATLLCQAPVPPPIPTSSCDDLCYWRVSGNNITGTNNVLGTLTNHDMRIQTNATNRGILTSTGNMGWNTMSPTARLHVDCAAGVSEQSGMSDIRFQNLESGTGTHLLTIDANGYVKRATGTSIPTLSCPSINFIPKVTSGGILSCSQIFDNGTSVGINATGPFTYTWAGAGGTLGGPTAPSASGTVRLEVNGVARALAYIATSDAKFKEQVNTIDDPFSIINKLEGKTYYWNQLAKSEKGADGGRQYGFIAQEVKEIMPEAVIIDEEGNHGVTYNSFIPLLTEGQKVLYRKYEEQRNLNDQLMKELDALKAKMLEFSNTNPASVKTAEATNQHILFQNNPNPFGSKTEIRYDIKNVAQEAFILILDLNGKELSRHRVSKGPGTVIIDGNNMIPGIYLYSLIIDGIEISTKRMVVSK